jgi:type II secretory pathway pseudopilin PulG
MTDHNAQRAMGTTEGFTLIETIVALSLGMLIVLGATQIFIEGLSHVRGVRAQALLTSDAGYMVQMIRHELLGADSVSVNLADPCDVDMTRGGTTRTLALLGERVFIAGDPVTHEGASVTSLACTEVGQSLRIEFTLSSGPRTNKTFTGQTTLALRTE